ncbi:MAG TPA: menaquinone biosynthesis protein [Thermoanaerobaculia bacterium]|nr:menaquinone biosynthesis protein [Thermoanaerobaculia bacterium]
MSKLRVGIVAFLNSRPLAWGFLEGRHTNLFEASFHPPAEVARRLAAGELDIGLIPAIEVQRIPGLSVLPGLCVAATHEVRSVLLVLDKPLEQVRRVALDENSRTSAALVKILFADRFGREPEYVEARPDLDEMFREADAALVIGDPALAVDRTRFQILDLAAEWRALTGLPAVFAVWAVRAGVELPDLSSYFEESLARGLAAMDQLVEGASRELGLERGEVERYLTEYLSYRLGPEELAALEAYYRRAARLGLIEEFRPLRLWQGAPQAAAVG